MKRGIKYKLIQRLVLATLVVLVGFFFLLNRYLTRHSLKELDNIIMLLAESATSSIRTALFYSDYNTLQSRVQPLLIETVDYLIVLDSSTDNVAYINDERNVTRSYPFKTMVQHHGRRQRIELDLSGEHYFQYLYRIDLPGSEQALGYLIMGVSQDKLHSRLIVGLRTILLVATLILFVILALTNYFLTHRVITPIMGLSRMISRFADGDHSVHIDTRTDDEIDILSRNFNKMADKIREQIDSIETYSKNLENMVEERTRALEKVSREKNLTEKRLMEAEKINSLNTLVSSIAHEINNPMAIISGNLQMLEGNFQDKEAKKRLRSMQKAIQRIDSLISDITFFSTLRSIDYAPVRMSQVIGGSVKTNVPKDVEVELSVCPDDGIISNAYILEMILEQILGNAVDIFIDRRINGRIILRCMRENDGITLTVSDNGGGIHDVSRVFEPFFTTGRNKKGLGMTFVFHAVKALNGDIQVTNISEGTEVSIHLPDMGANEGTT